MTGGQRLISLPAILLSAYLFRVDWQHPDRCVYPSLRLWLQSRLDTDNERQ